MFSIDNLHPKLFSHASNPVAIHLEADVYRVFYSGRDKNNKSSVSYVDIDIFNQKVMSFADEPLAEYGDNGSYYSHGISVGCVLHIENRQKLLFMGWQISDGHHWRGDIGAILLSSDFSSGEVSSEALLSSDQEDPISLSYPWVIEENGIYKMWYGSTIAWEAGNGEMLHVIKYATSQNGCDWHRHGLAIPYELGVAQAFSRPTVVRDKQEYHMWFSYRGGGRTKYRIGYAKSRDGISWKPQYNNSGIDISDKGWDSEMVCYPFVFNHKGKHYMLYNGNGFGQTGCGLAKLEEGI